MERGGEFAVLEECLGAVRGGSRGRLVLVSGEAGIGKTALLRRFCEASGGSARVLWGGCDSLFTPRALGPLFDIAQVTRGELARSLESGARPSDVATVLMREASGRSPTIVVFEDVHWADEATLDVLRLLGRRIESFPAMLVATYREGLDRAHPLRVMLGELPSGGARRLKLLPLSSSAVATLAERGGADAEQLYRQTAGNPFFVTGCSLREGLRCLSRSVMRYSRARLVCRRRRGHCSMRLPSRRRSVSCGCLKRLPEQRLSGSRSA